MGFDPSALLNNTAQGAATSLVSGAIGQGFSALSAARDWKYAKKLMARQHAYELENLAAQDKFQRQLAVDASSLRKRSLQNAGYSTADPEGTGTVAPTVSAPSSSASGMSISQTPTFAPGMTVTDLANANLMNSQAELNKIEAQWKSKKLAGEVGLLNAQIKEIQQLLPEKVNNIKSQTDKLVADKKLSEEQANQVIEATKKITEEISLLKIDEQYKPDLYKWQINEMKNTCFKLAQEGKFEKVKAELAQVGIIVGADWMTQLAAIVHKGTASQLLEELKNTIVGLFNTTGKIGSSVGQAIVDGIVDSVPEGAKATWKENAKDLKDPSSRRWDFQDK